MKSFFQTLIKSSNWFIVLVLRSPLHRMLSGNTMLVTVTGRKSGKRITTPVNYLRDGEVLKTLSSRDRTWWRNLRGGAPVTLHLQGREVPGWGEVIEEDAGVAASLASYICRSPQFARFLAVRTGPDGQPIEADLARAAASRVIIQVHVSSPAALH